MLKELTHFGKLYNRDEVLQAPCPVPKTRGIYAWFFTNLPETVPTAECIERDGFHLMYVGISPKNESSRQTLRSRLRTHFSGNAEGSTLRLTLGVLLESQSRFELRRVGSGKRLTFTHIGEQWLDSWMEKNAMVSWIEHASPWTIEHGLIQQLSLPLNLEGNSHPHCAALSAARAAAKYNARALSIADEGNQSRRSSNYGF